MKKLKLFALLLMGLSVSGTFYSCSDDDDDDDVQPVTNNTNNQNQQQNIAELAIGSGETDSLVVALQHANMVSTFQGSGNFTVFAPNNSAFAALVSASQGVNQISDFDTTALQNILKYHVLNAEVMSGSLTNQMYAATLNTEGPGMEETSLFIETSGGVNINQMATVTTADVDASNGVIHIIDNVLMTRNVAQLATNDSRFDSLVVALSSAGLVNTVATTPGITVFAPTNTAFQNLLSALNVNNISQIRSTLLDSVLKYHVYAAGNVQADQLPPLDGNSIDMLSGGSVTVNLSNGSQLTTTSGQNVNIIVTDAQGTNGVVHAIDEVMLY
ncbi:MAG: fasciclin domain-containing protein [Vicingaceae bacterium]